jgi:hypothetical protein
MTEEQFLKWFEAEQEQRHKMAAAVLGLTLEEWHHKLLENKLETRREGARQAEILIDAGWKFELSEIVNYPDNPSTIESEPWQWYWRSPPKRKGSKGRKYLSTKQAYNALKKIKV